MRHTKSHTANRRSHHALKSARFVACDHCKAPKRPHTVCAECGFYRGVQVVNMVAKAEKKQKKAKAKAAEAGK
jgi:large subunit ribosomal protein L32